DYNNPNIALNKRCISLFKDIVDELYDKALHFIAYEAPKDAEKAIEAELDKMRNELVNEAELQKVKNKTESMIAFEDMSVMSRAASLAYYELLGDAAWMNFELEKYGSVTTEDILQESRILFRNSNYSTIHYLSNN
ncbi:MAG: hypothetical protein LH619_11700, partial [Chitinophagaceae bacterium]|nr:hypothetical protein [Chitinophagaceae bacterium]